MDQYVSIVPRLLPSQYSSKRIPMNDEGYQYSDHRPMSSITNGQGYQQPIRTQDFNQQDYSNQLNSIDNSFKGRTNKSRLHHEALKDNSSDQTNSPPGNLYPNNSDYKLSENSSGYIYPNQSENSKQNYLNKSVKNLIIIFGIIIGLFSLTALAISIYLLIKMSNTTTNG